MSREQEGSRGGERHSSSRSGDGSGAAPATARVRRGTRTGFEESARGRRSDSRRNAPRDAGSETSRAARWRVAVRLAQRQVRRSRASSLLIMLLVALPIAGMSGLAVYVDSLIATPEERVRVELGRMQAWIAPAGVPDAGMSQDPASPWNIGYRLDADGVMTMPSGEPRTDIDGALPAGTEAIPVSAGELRIETANGAALVMAWGGEVWNDGFEGTFSLVEGRAPRADTEVLVTAATLERTGGSIGGTLTEAGGAVYDIVGVFTSATLGSAISGVVVTDATRFGPPQWYLPDLALSWSDVQDLNDAGIVAYSREVVLDPPPTRSDGTPVTDQRLAAMWQLVVALAIGGAFAAYVVIMLAGAAFAVSARRQQRALAIAASVGADSRDIRRTILMQGTVLGAVGGAVGVGAGVGIAAAVMALTSDGSATGFWGFHVPWPVLAGILVFAVLVGTFSALVPARSVARTDTIGALRGARRPQAVRASRPLWGSLMIVAGVGITIVSGVASAAVVGNSDLPWDSPLRWLPIVGIIAGPVIAQLGIVLSGRWLLWLVSLGLSRLGVAARMASRDAVANGSRTVPAFAAIGATVFIGVFALSLGTMTTGQSARNWSYVSPVGTATVSAWSMDEAGVPMTDAQSAEAIALARDELREAGAQRVATVGRQVEFWAEDPDDIPADLVRAVAVTPERALLPRDRGYEWVAQVSPQNNLSIVAVDDIETVTGVSLTASQRRAYEDGGALVLTGDLVTDGTVDIAAWPERAWHGGSGDGDELGVPPDNTYVSEPGQTVASPLWTREVPAIEAPAREQGLSVALAPATAEALGIRFRPEIAVGAFGGMPTEAQRDRVFEIGSMSPSDEYTISAYMEMGPGDASSWLVPLLATVAVLVLGASAVALGLARFERRPDDATLSAVGGNTGLRRAIGFWQGLVIAGFGTFAGAAAGVLPAIGFQMQSQGESGRSPMELADVPWWLVVALAVVLPLVIAAVNGLVPPRRPDLTRRTAIA